MAHQEILSTAVFSENSCGSDYDLHGAECCDNVIMNSYAIGGDKPSSDNVVNKAAIRVGNSQHIDGDHYNVFSNMTIVNYQGASTIGGSTGSAIEFVPSSHDNVVQWSRAQNTDIGIRVTAIGANKTLEVTGNRVEYVDFTDTTTPLYIYGDVNSIVHDLTIDHCRWVRPTNPIATFSYTDGAVFTNNTMTGSTFGSGVYALTVANAANLRVEGNDFSKLVRGVKLTNCPSARLTRNIFHDMTDPNVVSDQSGNTNAYFGKCDIVGFTPQLNVGTASTNFTVELTDGGGGSTVAASDPTTWLPEDQGYVSWTGDPISFNSTGSTLTAGVLYGCRMPLRSDDSFTDVSFTVATAGSGVTNAYVAVYQNGTLLAQSADIASMLGSTGNKTAPLSTTVSPIAGYVQLCFWVGAATSMPALLRASSSSASYHGMSASGSGYRFFSTADTGLTATAPATLGAQTAHSNAWWFAVA